MSRFPVDRNLHAQVLVAFMVYLYLVKQGQRVQQVVEVGLR